MDTMFSSAMNHMKFTTLQTVLPPALYCILEKEVQELRPAQAKAIDAGLLNGKNLLVCTPTASGKTLIAELAMMTTLLQHKGKVLYLVPLKALASEKYKQFQARYQALVRIALSIADLDARDGYLHTYDLIVSVPEKIDSLLRHHTPWITEIKVIVIDEIHLLNDPSRGPTLELLITLLKQLIPKAQIIGLSATIGNPQELATWLEAKLVEDTWRPVPLKKGIYNQNKITFYPS